MIAISGVGTATRRSLARVALVVASGVVLGPGRLRRTAAQGERATAPNWSFAALQAQDPYAGSVESGAPQVTADAGATPIAAARVVGFEVEVDNSSDQPLDFSPSDVRLRLADGVEYRGGVTIGAEPRISSRMLNPGERSRGWVWFAVPGDAELLELVYVAPPPELRIQLESR